MSRDDEGRYFAVAACCLIFGSLAAWLFGVTPCSLVLLAGLIVYGLGKFMSAVR